MSDPRVELGRLSQEFGQIEAAEQYLDEALALNPADHRAWTAKGQMREKAGELDQALQNYQRSLSINSYQPAVYNQVATLRTRLAQNAITGQSSGTWTAKTHCQVQRRVRQGISCPPPCLCSRQPVSLSTVRQPS